MQKQSRECRHAGDWYPNAAAKLNHQIHELLAKAHIDHHPKKIKAIIVPHGSLSCSGSTAAAAYKHLLGSQYERVFVLGPTHKCFIKGCNLTYMDQLETPLGTLDVDKDVVSKLKEGLYFRLIDIDKDEEEHSIEMQLPFIIKIFDKKSKIIPLLTGPLDDDMLLEYAKALSNYFEDPASLFIISTDFCHWGDRHDEKPKDKSHKEIWDCIRKVDEEGMRAIESHSLHDVRAYIHRTNNTICGRESVYMLMKLMEASKLHLKTKFIKYHQNQQKSDTSSHLTSYASAITYYEE